MEGPGSARLVAISGEAGIGKSRLADELLAMVRQAGGRGRKRPVLRRRTSPSTGAGRRVAA